MTKKTPREPAPNRRRADQVSPSCPQQAVAELDLSGIDSLSALKRLVEKRRGSRITIEETRLLNGVDVCGLWGRRGKKDVILHAETPSEFHRTQIIMHELAHMILNHDADPTGAETNALATALFPDLDPNRFRLRSYFESEKEQEAELLADLLADALRRNRETPHPLEAVFS